MAVAVTVYQSDAPCIQCQTTKLRLNRPGKGLPAIPFQAVTADDAAIDRFRAEGHSSFPVVTVDREGEPPWTWSGFRLTEIEKLAEFFR